MSWQIASFALLLLALGSGMLWYERSRPPSQIVALVAVLAALAVAGRIVLAPIPNVVATTDIVLIAGYALGPAAGFAVGAIGGLVSNFWLGQGVWTPWQMLGWGLAGIAGAALWKVTSGRAGRLTLAVVCALAGVAFGALMNLQTLVSYGGDMSPARYLALEVRAIPFDLAHMTGNFVFAMIAGPAMIAALTRFRERFEWRRVSGSTGLTLMVLSAVIFAVGGAAPPKAAAAPAGVKQAKQWLAAQINADGGFGREPGLKSGLMTTTDAMLAFGRTGRNIDTVSSASGKTPMIWLKNHKGKITGSSSPNELIGNLAKTVLAIKSVNRNPRSLGGTDLVGKLVTAIRKDATAGGWVNTAAYAVMALRSVGEQKSVISPSEKWLCSTRQENGSWGIGRSADGDVDTTGAVLLVVGGEQAADRAITFLRRHQHTNGGFDSGFLGVNSQSTALAIQGMLGAGLDARSVKKGGFSGLDYLRANQTKAGFIRKRGDSGTTDSIWVTAQALPSLARNPYFEETPRDCGDFVKREKPKPEGSGGTGGGSGTGYSPGPGSAAPGPSTGPGRDSGPGGGKPSKPGPAPTGPGEGAPPANTKPAPATPVPTTVPVVPDAALLAASAAGPTPSAPVAILICLVVSGGLCGGTIWLARRFRW